MNAVFDAFIDVSGVFEKENSVQEVITNLHTFEKYQARFVLNANVYVPYDNISSLPEEKLNYLIVVIKDPYGFNVIAVIWCLLSKFVLISK